ncbi:hypothetical protein Micbo1qcDRAFT_128908, partial [Microdochium bolleyi]
QRAASQQRRADDERRRAEDVAAQSRQTTLLEYITSCHRYLDLNVAVEPSKSLTSKGAITNPLDKLVPSTLKLWTDFLEQQKSIHRRLYSDFRADKRAFESITFLKELGEQLTRKKIANERDLEAAQHNIIETPVTNIIEILRDYDTTQRTFAQASASPSITTKCAHLAFVVKYKPPHKLTLPYLHTSLREMDIQQEVVNRSTIPTDKDELFSYHANRVVATALSQTYHYIITGGLTYSYMTTGEAIIFLKVDWGNKHAQGREELKGAYGPLDLLKTPLSQIINRLESIPLGNLSRFKKCKELSGKHQPRENEAPKGKIALMKRSAAISFEDQ